MTLTRLSALGLALVLLGTAAPALGQDAVTLTVDEAVARAVAHAPRLDEVRARARAAGSTAGARSALARPSLTASAGFVRTNHVDEFGIVQPDGNLRVIFPDIPSNYRVRAELGVPLYTGGRVAALVASARADQRAALAEQDAMTADIELETLVAYWSLALSRARVEVLTQADARAGSMVEDVTARVDTGLLPPNERLSAEAQRARQRVLLVSAEHEAALAAMQLARLTGLPLDAPIVLATTLDVAASDALSGEPADVLAARAVAARPERLVLAERRASAEAVGAAAGAAARPQVAALAAVEPARPNARFVPRADQWHTSWDLGVNVTWSLWDGGRARAERAAAQAQAEAIDARIEDFDAALGLEVRQRQLDVSAARAGLAAADEAVAAAREARRVIGERFEVGVATSTEVLDSDLVLLETELERTRLAVTLRLSAARLARTVGARP